MEHGKSSHWKKLVIKKTKKSFAKYCNQSCFETIIPSYGEKHWNSQWDLNTIAFNSSQTGPKINLQAEKKINIRLKPTMLLSCMDWSLCSFFRPDSMFYFILFLLVKFFFQKIQYLLFFHLHNEIRSQGKKTIIWKACHHKTMNLWEILQHLKLWNEAFFFDHKTYIHTKKIVSDK